MVCMAGTRTTACWRSMVDWLPFSVRCLCMNSRTKERSMRAHAARDIRYSFVWTSRRCVRAYVAAGRLCSTLAIIVISIDKTEAVLFLFFDKTQNFPEISLISATAFLMSPCFGEPYLPFADGFFVASNF